MRYSRIRNAAILLGAGLGGLLDGMVLHEAAQWLHGAAWLVTLAGVLGLWNGLRGPGRLPATRTLVGYMLVGWGGVKLVEGIVNHHLVGLHPLRDLPPHVVFYDWAFIVLSGALILLGLALREGKDAVQAPPVERRGGHDRRLAY